MPDPSSRTAALSTEREVGTPHAGETALLVVDMQNSMFEFPALAEVKAALAGAVNELIGAARDAGRHVVVVRTQHERDRSTWTLNMLADGEGFAFPETEQARLLADVDVDLSKDLEIVKTRDSAFHGTDLAAQLCARGVKNLLICGVSTHACVAQTAIDAFAHQFHTAVAVDAVASEDTGLSTAALTFLVQEMRQPLLHQGAACQMLRAGTVPVTGDATPDDAGAA